MSTLTHSPAEALDKQRRAFLLHQVAKARDGRLTPSDANKIPAGLLRVLQLSVDDANRLREELCQEGRLLSGKIGRSVKIAITESGKELLRELERYIPLQPARGEVKPAEHEVERARETYLLLQLLALPEGGATASALKAPPAFLELNSATTRHGREQLAIRGLIAVHRGSRSEKFALTPAGLRHLTGLSFDAFKELKLKGPALTALLAAARDCHKGSNTTPPSPPPAGLQAPPPVVSRPTTHPAELGAAVMDVFRSLLRERHTTTGMVPVHEVRTTIRERHGEEAASHEVLDPAILSLWQSNRVRLSPIVDRGAATQAQQQDSIPGVGETLFYLESAHDSAVV